jgi:hypothetical protein
MLQICHVSFIHSSGNPGRSRGAIMLISFISCKHYETVLPIAARKRRILSEPQVVRFPLSVRSARIGIVQLFAFVSSVIVAYTNGGYLRCLQMPTYESGYAQMSHRDLWKPSCGDSEYPVFGRYKDMYCQT